MSQIDAYEKIDIAGQLQCFELHYQAEADRWHVMCWASPDSNEENLELSWDVDGVVIADSGVRQTRRPYTEAEARAEFERWRK